MGGQLTGVVLMDLQQQPFDTVSHDIVLDKLTTLQRKLF